MPRVSIVIPTFNAAQYLPYSLNSILKQTYTDWEAVLVDDGSTDHTRALLERSMEDFGGRLHYFYQANSGLSRARNLAISRAQGELIALLDADDVWLPHRLERQILIFDRYPNVGLVHGRVARINVRNEVIAYPEAPPTKYLAGMIAQYLYTRQAHILCPTVMLRARCLQTVGYFDEEMIATEDRDLWFRIAQQFEVAYIPDVIAYYRLSPNSMSSNWDRMYAYQRHFARKHYHNGACGRAAYCRALGNIYRERGDMVFKEGNVRQALSWYARAVITSPISSENIYMCMRALAEPVLSRVRSFTT